MAPLSFSQLAEATGGRLVAVEGATVGTVISTDSRTLNAGDIFWALPGERYDGHQFCADALKRGASLVVGAVGQLQNVTGPRLLVDDSSAALGRLAQWWRRRQDALVIGVTGSVGKTTTKELIYSVLSHQFPGMRSPGNYNNLVGLPKSLLSIEPQDAFAVLELGASHVGDIAALAALAEPEVGVITPIGKAHLESFGSLASIIQTKGELLAALPEHGFAVLPGDDPVTVAMAARAACRTIFVGEKAGNDVRATNVRSDRDSLTFDVDGESYYVPLTGRHFVVNALSAIAIAREIGIPASQIAAGLRTATTAPGRARVIASASWTVIDDSYNASPTAVAAACQLLSNFPTSQGRRRFLVLGDMRELGSAAAWEHAAIGRLAADLRLDGVLAFGDHADAVASGALAAGLPRSRLAATRDQDVLLAILDCWIEPGDVVLVKGSRAMQMERVTAWLTSPDRGGSRQRCA